MKTVKAYLDLAYENVEAKLDWSWTELIDFNNNIAGKLEKWSKSQLTLK